MQKISGELHDEVTGGNLPVEVELDGGLWVKLHGFGTAEAPNGDGWVVKIEFWEGRPQVVVWNSISDSDPQVIDLSAAAESLRTISD